jgi:hypothetical protein
MSWTDSREGEDRSDRIEVPPVLPSRDIDETPAFNGNERGFNEIVYQRADQLILRRDGMELHFRRAPGPVVVRQHVRLSAWRRHRRASCRIFRKSRGEPDHS